MYNRVLPDTAMAKTHEDDRRAWEEHLSGLAHVIGIYINRIDPSLNEHEPKTDANRILNLLGGLQREILDSSPEATHAVYGLSTEVIAGNGDITKYEIALGARFLMNTIELRSEILEQITKAHRLSEDIRAQIGAVRIGRLGTNVDPINAVIYWRFGVGSTLYEGLMIDIRSTPATKIARMIAFE